MKKSEEIRKDIETIRCCVKKIIHPDKYILIKAWILYSNGRLMHYNWGDDMARQFGAIKVVGCNSQSGKP